MMDLAISREDLIREIYKTCDANKQKDHVHIRLMITRGLKPTPYQSPKITIGNPTIVIVPEIKKSSEETLVVGIKLATVSTRRGRPDVQDPAWNSHSKLNCISACIQGQQVRCADVVR
jgi:branched-chain amino acid aminotransferase